MGFASANCQNFRHQYFAVPTPPKFYPAKVLCYTVCKQRHKNQNTKNLPRCYNYSSNNAISSFKQAECSNICPLENFKNLNEIMFSSDSQPACLSTLTDLKPIPLSVWPSNYVPENKRYFCRHEPLLFRLQYSLYAMTYPFSFILTD